MFQRKKSSRIFSFLMVLIMLFGTLPTYANDGMELLPLDQGNQYMVENYIEKIDPAVQELFSQDNELIDVLVYMKDKADVFGVSKNNAIGKTPFAKELSSRKAVINELKNVAEESQVNLLNYLDSFERNGEAEFVKSFHIVNIVHVKATKNVIESIAQMPEVKTIYLNGKVELEEPVINDIELQAVSDDEIEWNIKQVAANAVWEKLGIDGTGVVVGIIDSGVKWDHPALKEKWRGYNPVTGATTAEGNWFDPINKKALPEDPTSFHGSHVAGTVLGQEADGTNAIGVAPGAKWIAANGFTGPLAGNHSILLECAQWMLAPGGKAENAPDIVNNSWGGQAIIDPWFAGVVDSWRAANILPVFAAGNQKSGEPSPWPGSIQNPANLLTVFSVGATDINNIRGSFSKLGPSLYDPEGKVYKPDISAPGVGIRSAAGDGTYVGGWNGTSMAAPHIAGVAALMKSANASLTIAEMENIMEETAIPLTDNTYPTSPNMGYGYGLVNAFDAVSEVLGNGQGTIKGNVYTGGEDTQEPTIEHTKANDVYIGEEVTITANISDDVAIIEAKLLVKNNDLTEWMEIPMVLKSGSAKDGIYEGKITSGLVIESGFQYKIVAKDFGQNEIKTEIYTINIIFGVLPNKYSNDFEKDVKGWSFDGEFSWGSTGTSPLSEPVAFNGSRLIGTKIGSYDVSNNMTNIAVAPPIDLRDPSLVSAKISFQQWKSVSYFHKARVEISTDGGKTWAQLLAVTGSDMTWKPVDLDLTGYIGNENPINIRFYYQTSDTGYSNGWYIDDYKVIGTTTADPIPVTGVTLDKVSITLQKDETYTLLAAITPANASNKKISWASDNPTVATVDQNGLVIAISLGTANITVTTEDGNKTATCAVTVTEEVVKPEVIIPGEYSNDFETEIDKWLLEGEWSWGTPSHVDEPAGASKLLGTKIGSGDVTPNTISNLILPAIDLSNSTLNSASLVFDNWLDMGYNHKAKIEISTDNGSTYNLLKTIYSNYGFWKPEYVNLKPYIGQTNPVLVRLQLDTNATSSYGIDTVGWYIDNIELRGMDLVPPTTPTGFKSETTTTGIKLNWNGNYDLDFKEFNLYRGTTEGGVKTKVITTKNTEYIDTSVVSGTTYYYMLEAVDLAGNISKSQELEHKFVKIEKLFEENFEDNNGGFTTGLIDPVGTNSWEWGARGGYTGPTTGMTGTKMWATNLTGYPTKSHSAYIESPAITLPSDKDGQLQVDQWLYVYNSYGTMTNYGTISVSDDGGTTWIVVKDKITGANKWESITADLSAYKGKDIKIRFSFFTGTGSIYEAGWYIDSISIVPKTTGSSMSLEGGTSYLPVDATVTILETGRSVRTNLTDGSFTMKHAASEAGKPWTMVVESYGYHSKEISIDLSAEQIISETIVLEPIQKGNLLGTIVNEDDDTPIANAKVRVLEEPGLYIVTDSNGNYTINDLLAGDYTLKITSSSHYSTTKLVQVIGNEDNIVDITMERFVTNGDPDEIAYDDGSHEDGRTFTNPGAGFGVRFTPEKFGRLKSAKIYFIGDHPTAVGTEINIGVVKVDDRGNIVHFSPMRKITIERGAWNTIDLTDFDVLTDEDFYIVTQQIHPLAGSPRIGIDTSSTADRSYVFNGGSLVKLNGADGYNIPGGMLMRAIMEYPSSGYVAKPVISNLDVNNYINTDNLTIEGSIALDAKVNIYVNNSLVKTIDTVAKKFSSVIQLASETNIIRLEAQIGDALSGKTDPINVIVDKLAPVVEITNPVTNISTKETSLVVTGKVTDKNLDYVSVNSKKIQVALDGNFTENIELQKGKNILTLIATDKAGNSTTVTREIFCGEEVVELTNLLPAENVLTEIGKNVKVSFNAPTGGKGYFKLLVPMGVLNTEESYGTQMTEISEGLYEGTWTIPAGFVAKDLEIEFTFVSAGNEVVTAKAPGKISVKQAIMFELENITPTEDSILKVGDKLEVSFNAPAEGNGYIIITGDDVDLPKLAMEEIESGLYKGIWTVPAGLENKELEINVEFVSKEGFEAVGKAAGKINIRELKPEEKPTHIINLPNSTVIFDGVAYDMDYLETYANGQRKLIAWHNSGKDIFVKKLDGTLVNFKDEEITIELLPDSIIYYSINGKATIYTK